MSKNRLSADFDEDARSDSFNKSTQQWMAVLSVNQLNTRFLD